MVKADGKVLIGIYRDLFKSFGPQQWWPGETPFEVIIGAILTQNTNWKNVEKAISNLKSSGKLSPAAFLTIPEQKLAELIRPAGYFNVKAKRLKNFIRFFFDAYKGKISLMKKAPLSRLREELLSVNGIGEETADSILLYALEKPVFVVDAYTKRIFYRHKIIQSDADYQTVQKHFMDNLPRNQLLFNEYHALIVKTAKKFCRAKTCCALCPLKKYLQ
ncbi:MAG: endonuclease III domain-containing protein [Candidatus Omnitrophica bacterium]|nr:endonuclease III domain-containing protein [Candidatus Omnitrophota bacterium]